MKMTTRYRLSVTYNDYRRETQIYPTSELAIAEYTRLIETLYYHITAMTVVLEIPQGSRYEKITIMRMSY